MAIITQLISGARSPQKRMQALDTSLDLLTGVAAGILLNDIWEMGKLPGYFQNTGVALVAQDGRMINIGWDDVTQFGIGFILMILPMFGIFRREVVSVSLSSVGVGIMVATLVTKAGEVYDIPIQIIPHQQTPP